MSLVLTSNKSGYGNDLPYQYHNYLSQPLKLEPDSEVAVQSVKVVKNGNVGLVPENNVFYTYTGTNPNTANGDLDANGNVDMSFGISAPVKGLITGATDYGFSEVNTETLATLLASSIDSSLAHPNLVKSNIGPGTSVSVLRETSGDVGKFKGFDYSINQSNSASNVDYKSSLVFKDLLGGNPDYNGSWNASTHRITKTATSLECDMVATTPISLNGGEFSFNWENAGGGWATGLVRYIPNLDGDGEIYNQTLESVNPPYFSDGGEDVNDSFFDYKLESRVNNSGDYELRLYHTIYSPEDAEDVGFRVIEFHEIEYWTNGPDHASLTGPLPLFDTQASYTGSASNVRSAVMTCENERLKIIVTNGNGSNFTLVDGNTGTGTDKLRKLKPIGLANRWLYPKVYIEDTNSYMTLTKYNGVVPENWSYEGQLARYNDGNLEDYSNSYDYVARLSSLEGYDTQTYSLEELSTREPYNFSAGSITQNYTQAGLSGSFMSNASGTYSDLLLAEVQPDNVGNYQRVYTTTGANAENIFGFLGDPFPTKISASSSSGVTNYKSNQVPTMVSAGSIFVRLDNFNSETFNGEMSGPSKILYHMPRFDGSGNAFGGLFFEPSEKTYVKLNNPQTLYLNDFDVSLCSADEKLAENITGKTIVMLHFRKSKM